MNGGPVSRMNGPDRQFPVVDCVDDAVVADA